MSVSVLLLTLNEEANLPDCLAAVSWSDDIVVLDSYSSDRTTDIARQFGARVYQRKFDSFSGQRNYALDEIEFKYNWVLHLDADEIITPALRVELLETIENGCFDAYRIPSKTIFMGQWLKFSGMYPTYQVRFGHRDRLRFKQVGHGQQEDLPAERVGTLAEPYVHYSFSKGLTDWFEKHNRYSADEAREAVRFMRTNRRPGWGDSLSRESTRRRRALKQLSLRLPLRPFFRFFYMYVLRRGFLDGRAGLTYCLMLAVYEYMIVLKQRELLSMPRDVI